MNVLEFHKKLSSPDHNRVHQFSQTSILFNMINGSAIREEELVGMTNNGNKFQVHFVSEQCAIKAKDELDAQIVPGVSGNPLYGIMAEKENNFLNIKFVEL